MRAHKRHSQGKNPAYRSRIPVLNAHDKPSTGNTPPPQLTRNAVRQVIVPFLIALLVLAALAMLLALGMLFGDLISRLYNFLGH